MVIWLFSHFQYVIVAVAFSISSHFRLSMRTNLPFMSYLVFISLILIILLLLGDGTKPFDVFSSVFSLQKGVPLLFRVTLLLMVVLDALAALAVEYILVDRVIRQMQSPKVRTKDLELSPLSASPTRHYYGF